MGTTVKKMSVVQLTVLTAINMLGSGIVLLPSKLAQVGTISIFSWIVTALGSLALAYAFAKCGRFSRKPGGMGGYAEYAFGRSGNFMSNYTYGVSLLIANVAIAITAVGYSTELFHVTLTPIGVAGATVVLLWLTTIANFGGPQITGQIGNVTIMGVIIPVLGVSVLGWFWFDSSLYVAAWNPHDMPIFQAVGASISITLWAFLGLESACANTDAVENPERNVPIAVLGGTIGAAVIYIASTNVIAGIVPNMDLAASTAPFGLAFATMFTPLVGNIVMGLMIMACIGSLLGWQFTIAQVFKSSADVGYFLKIFAKTTKSGTPIAGMLVLVVCQTALTLMTISPDLSKQFDMIVNLAVVTNLVPYLMSMAALMTIQKAAGITPRKALFANGIAYIAAAYSYYALYSSGADAMMLGGIVTMLGWTLYGTVSRRFMTADTPVEDVAKA
ncbi:MULTISPECIES: putrescine-ornithine antiporter [unclassified Pseudomonas]|uniref:putrescine-ornithine antiporter n=2 Tax=Pseudomonas TaxID=286 RepID=UPI00191270F8|nr:MULTISPECIES: putrescine-ornithine antiporter [unclassified Pseudomonas]MBK5549088.1 putrescine-ornithine antiporter [Pseudomonas sp. TH03]MEB0223030.1 putrescine-ornithine antiporter [Pseudomonas sp. 5S1]MEB0293564.1 putrescine-ornithine antiporter [Pseudomonas sp. 10S4]